MKRMHILLFVALSLPCSNANANDDKEEIIDETIMKK